MERYLQRVLGSSKFEGVCSTRSKTMGAIRGKGNKTTERVLRMALVRDGVSGWHLHSKELPGKPDFFFPEQKVAIFVDGCFWHGCARCGHTPHTRSEFWKAKFERNQTRDRRVARQLRKAGVSVIRLWEHQLKTGKGIESAMRRIRPLLLRRSTSTCP